MKKKLSKRSKLPTKKEEADFVKNLSPREKQYTVFDCVEVPVSGDWDGVVIDGRFRRLVNDFKGHVGRLLVYFD